MAEGQDAQALNGLLNAFIREHNALAAEQATILSTALSTYTCLTDGIGDLDDLRMKMVQAEAVHASTLSRYRDALSDLVQKVDDL